MKLYDHRRSYPTELNIILVHDAPRRWKANSMMQMVDPSL